MQQLFTNYSVGLVLMFVIIIAIAIKLLVSFVDWFQSRTKTAVKERERPEELANKAKQQEELLNQIKTLINELKNSIQLLIASDRDDIKQSLTKDHHYFCYKLGSIDDYSLDCMLKRYSHYKLLGGNSFIETLMLEVRALPKKIEKNNR